MTEFDLIQRYFAPLSAPEGLGLCDDAAILHIPESFELVVTKDVLVAGTHFFTDDAPDTIAQKALRCNLSDLAAMGAKPWRYFLGLTLARYTGENWLARFCDGLRYDQQTYDIVLAGGDSTVAMGGRLTICVTMLGLVPRGKALLRSGAKAGDDVYASGTIGDAALGLLVAQGKPVDALNKANQDYVLQRYRVPSPRIGLGLALHPHVSAAMDISDGLMQDAGHIASASDVGMRIEAANVPYSQAAKQYVDMMDDALLLTGGDDYELLFTAAKNQRSAIEKAAQRVNNPVSRIGVVTQGNAVQLVDANGKEKRLTHTGYQHQV